MGCKHMTGGEPNFYTELGDESRRKSVDRMLEMAERLGANGIINYVPVGAMGNIVAEIAAILERKPSP